MTISQLITELQKLQALHGDLPVTLPEQDGGDHGTFESLELQTETFYDLGKCSGPHIHLS